LTAADVMSRNPVSINGGASIEEVVAFLTDTGYSAAPVIDEACRPVGVVSRTDIVVYDRARAAGADAPVPAEARRALCAADLMTPIVFSVAPDEPALQVAKRMST